jgi:hypothetical protein
LKLFSIEEKIAVVRASNLRNRFEAAQFIDKFMILINELAPKEGQTHIDSTTLAELFY